MYSLPKPSFLNAYWQDCFNVKKHLEQFLQIDKELLDNFLKSGQKQLGELGNKDFDWQKTEEFYRDRVGDLYLFDLAAWHLGSQDYIGDTLRLIADNVQGQVLDFGGGIGTHSIAAALCPQVQQVIYCDINPRNIDFVKYRVNQMGLEQKIEYCSEIPDKQIFDTIICFDVLEHLAAPSQQVLTFKQILSSQGKMIINWHFFKGHNQEFPFHLDDPHLIDEFFIALQQNFLEIFHPYNITTRCYRKMK
ncbi:Methyltransferase type 11 [Rippkaea orientalis PCC 8801]|uniref:Methyltransferase type 11 n=1 Tax=Rippkaea orientalis (strain PCC 8801 / RF-1) TaxID=41431 RepID=B7JUX0_RIPO1|nr:methyltransferase domain-containing protein [Rippkaea orientalis]ACK66822.1 Methyltransferase type 11 [Rippkaea orientalis PCC 8801]